jgi:hypothetical protein
VSVPCRVATGVIGRRSVTVVAGVSGRLVVVGYGVVNPTSLPDEELADPVCCAEAVRESP